MSVDLIRHISNAKLSNIISSNNNLEDKQAEDRRGHTSSGRLHFVSGEGGTKRKIMESSSNPSTGIDYSIEEPKLKRRYEERMSTKLGNICLREEPAAPQKDQTQTQSPNGPHIEEIEDWDEELFEDDDLMSQAMKAPIVEEPAEESPNEREKSLSPNKEATGEEEEGHEQQQRILLSSELRSLLNAIDQEQHEILPIARPLRRTGRELIPYTRSAFQYQQLMQHEASAADPTTKQLQTCGIEEIFDDEVLPDSANSPQVQLADDEISEEPTSSLEAPYSEDEKGTGKGQSTSDEEESAMEID